jgi:hypothetical protein
VRPYLEKTHHQEGADRVAQGEGPEFKPQYKNKKFNLTNKKEEINQN